MVFQNRVKRFALVSISLLVVVACSSDTRQLFFDIQPPTDTDMAEKSLSDQGAKTATLANDSKLSMETWAFLFPSLNSDLPAPPIEKILDWEEVESRLPKDEEDNVDWTAALEQGLIQPRPGSDPKTLLMSTFQWDFIIPAIVDEEEEDEDEEVKDDEVDESDTVQNGIPGGHEDDAYFPHSAHTQWLSCKNCHMTIYPYRRNPATMKEMKKGKSCGVCHGRNKVSFSLKACDRCHLNSE